jgi:arginase
MALATAAGRCWSQIADTVPGFCPVPERQVALVGARDLDVNERVLLDRSEVHVVDPQRMRKQGLDAGLGPVLTSIRALAGRAYLHIDLDVLDPAEARVNQFAAPGGLTLAELLEVIGLVRKRFALGAAAITAYDPDYDHDDNAVRAAVAVIRELARQ